MVLQREGKVAEEPETSLSAGITEYLMNDE